MNKLSVIAHNILTSVQSIDSSGGPSFDVNLLHASPVAEAALNAIVNDYLILLDLPPLREHAIYSADILGELWYPLSVVLNRFAYSPTPPHSDDLKTLANSTAHLQSHSGSFFGSHISRLIRLCKLAQCGDANFTKSFHSPQLLKGLEAHLYFEELAAALAAISKLDFVIISAPSLLNADEYAVNCARVADSIVA